MGAVISRFRRVIASSSIFSEGTRVDNPEM